MTLSLAMGTAGAPKPNRASKKNKKSWRKNVAMGEVEAALEEERFEERVGGKFSDRPDSKLFIIEEKPGREGRRDRKVPRKLRSLANLEGLPGVADPKPLRNSTRLPEDRENPKTRKQKRDKRERMFVELREKREKETRLREMEVMRVKSLKKELTKEEERTKENQARKEKEKEEKKANPTQLSNYKYEPQEEELKLSEELTGNLRSLVPEGSLLEDRFKSMQRRNMIEVRVKQRTKRILKRKKVEKRSHRMGWEENKNVVAKRIRQEAKTKKKKSAKKAQAAEKEHD